MSTEPTLIKYMHSDGVPSLHTQRKRNVQQTRIDLASPLNVLEDDFVLEKELRAQATHNLLCNDNRISMTKKSRKRARHVQP
jgi:hypothetical protein